MNTTLMDHATDTIAVGSKSFATAARLFDPATRRSVLMLYAWCRYCDDVIDGQELGFNATPVDSAQAERRLEMLKNQTLRAWEGGEMHEPAFAAFQEVALGHNIPLQLAYDHLDGFAMDVRETHYETFDDNLQYCYRVAGVVGLMMARVMGVRDDAVLDRACDLGLAFQLTNIARDIVEDARVGRCYLPAQWLAEENIPPEAIATPQMRQPLAGLARRLVAEAEPYYASARAGLAGLPLRSAWAIASAHGVYREIGMKVSAAGPRAWDKRQGTNGVEKAGLLLKGAGLALTSRLATQAPRPAGLWQRPR
ncbi:phytoene/squalene synthase family protein [Leclercia sp. 29361]|uniref:15-cis-phytoene synthase CrtB n=1 Tax=Leclercia sp. 29361 TaxID=2714951 RepID=UPI00140B6969|nr:15-cis-phytoene synthase CrtB [Leclercia sp. 29361]QIK13190.1 phytoene/squalene synthase family protein [Leclercia sp. 29361]